MLSTVGKIGFTNLWQAQSDISGSNHPYLNDPQKSRKPSGPAATAKIHGSVDTSGPTGEGTKGKPAKKDEAKTPEEKAEEEGKSS